MTRRSFPSFMNLSPAALLGEAAQAETASVDADVVQPRCQEGRTHDAVWSQNDEGPERGLRLTGSPRSCGSRSQSSPGAATHCGLLGVWQPCPSNVPESYILPVGSSDCTHTPCPRHHSIHSPRQRSFLPSSSCCRTRPSFVIRVSLRLHPCSMEALPFYNTCMWVRLKSWDPAAECILERDTWYLYRMGDEKMSPWAEWRLNHLRITENTSFIPEVFIGWISMSPEEQRRFVNKPLGHMTVTLTP